MNWPPTPIVTQTGEYHLVEPIGTPGGFAEVFSYQADHGGLVAVKILRPQIAPGRREIQIAEGRVLSKLRGEACPNIVTFFESVDLGRAGLALLMQYVQGSDLRELVGQPLSLSDIGRIVDDVARGLAVAHELDVVHRDLKPANVIFKRRREGASERDLAVILDFGISTLLGKTALPHYGTQEYIDEHHENGDPASDWYSLGVVTFELASGRSLVTWIPELGINPNDLHFPSEVRRAIAVELAKARAGDNDELAAAAPLVELLLGPGRYAEDIRERIREYTDALRGGEELPSTAPFEEQAELHGEDEKLEQGSEISASTPTTGQPRSRGRIWGIASAVGSLALILLVVAAWRLTDESPGNAVTRSGALSVDESVGPIAASEGNLWFPNANDNKLTRWSPSTETLTDFDLPPDEHFGSLGPGSPHIIAGGGYAVSSAGDRVGVVTDLGKLVTFDGRTGIRRGPARDVQSVQSHLALDDRFAYIYGFSTLPLVRVNLETGSQRRVSESSVELGGRSAVVPAGDVVWAFQFYRERLDLLDAGTLERKTGWFQLPQVNGITVDGDGTAYLAHPKSISLYTSDSETETRTWDIGGIQSLAYADDTVCAAIGNEIVPLRFSSGSLAERTVRQEDPVGLEGEFQSLTADGDACWATSRTESGKLVISRIDV